jgi:hypothetical protein
MRNSVAALRTRRASDRADSSINNAASRQRKAGTAAATGPNFQYPELEARLAI